MSLTNTYCEALGIPVPRLEQAAKSSDANYYSLLLAALLERGESLTLEEVAKRFETAGIAPADRALASLKRCKPARAPIYRDGDRYALDPHDDEADLWAFRLGLRPAKAARLEVVRPDPGPLPSVEASLSVAALEEAWRDGIPNTWSAQRVALCVLDAHGGAMRPGEVLAFLGAHGHGRAVLAEAARYWRKGAPIQVRGDGRWEIDATHPALRSARQALRERVEVARRWTAMRPDPAVMEAHRRHFERKRRAHAEELARMRRVLLYAFPAKRPKALVLLDVGRRELHTFLGDEIAAARERIAGYDFIAARDVRALLRTLGVDPGARRLAELGPAQKSRRLNRRGRTLRITTSLLVQGSCNLSRPFASPERLRHYAREKELTKLRRRLEADAKALFALYQYGCLHGAVRLRWGFLDEWIPAPWVHRDEPRLRDLMAQARKTGAPLEVVVGGAPGWNDPWSRAEPAAVGVDASGWRLWLVDAEHRLIDEAEVQLARLAAPRPPG